LTSLLRRQQALVEITKGQPEGKKQTGVYAVKAVQISDADLVNSSTATPFSDWTPAWFGMLIEGTHNR